MGTKSSGGAPSTAPEPTDYLERGLEPHMVAERLAAGLSNAVPHSPARTIGQILRANVLTRFNAILGSLFIVAIVVGPPQDAFFGIVLAANTAIGVAQEWRAKRTLDRLSVLVAPTCTVVRGGIEHETKPHEVVLGDLIALHAGDQVPVDGVVLASDGLELDEGLLTGEAEPVPKIAGETVLSGTFVVAGSGRARTTGIGTSAYAQHLQLRARRFLPIHSDLREGTNQILRWVTWFMVPTGAALVLSQIFRSHQSLSDSARSSVAGVGAMVPEGLVLLSSIAFAAGALRLASSHVLVQELAAVEGLARVDVLCIDKTGTLTSPGMRLDGISLLGSASIHEVEDVLAAISGSDPAPNATTRAIAERCPATPDWDVEDRIPFSSERKWSAVTFARQGTWLLGAPDIVIAGERERSQWQHELSLLQNAGSRVLLLAFSSRKPADGRLPLGVAPIALLSISEQVRADASATVLFLTKEDVEIKVLSGDAPATVRAIAEKAGVSCLGEPRDATLLGDDPESLRPILESTSIFGRVRPEQKLAMVRSLKEAGHVVAMVGDGVNDVQALKEADLGIAMGSGSGAARSVARLVLLDDSFASVPHVLAEGRRVVANIERVAKLFVTKTVYAALLAAVVAVSGVPFPFFPRHLSIVSTLTIGVPGFFLAFSPGAPRASRGFVTTVVRFAIPAGITAASATYIAYSIARSLSDSSAVQARTSAILVLFVTSLWVLALVARPWNHLRILLVILMGAGIVPVLTVPIAKDIFSLALPPAPVLALDALVAFGSIAGISGLVMRFSDIHQGRPDDRIGSSGEAGMISGREARRPIGSIDSKY